MNISAGEFKAKCLKLMEKVRQNHEEIIITKFGKPMCKLVPLNEVREDRPLYGFLKDMVEIKGDIVGPLGEQWHAEK
ncbi:MAG: type II toxin-antitoxin system Phd/YefM family antitoxin [Candidatus Omnitrophica bacterium]|nr:type II toxin-antitoxin system Phd/YefM family antitoxin [Candidatus Omnitrophota bacterium]